MKVYRLKPSLKESKNNYLLEDYLDGNADKLFIPKEQIPVIIRALEYIFGTNRKIEENGKPNIDIIEEWTTSPNSNLSILYPENFSKYFRWGLLSEDISSKEFNNYRTKSFTQNIDTLNKWVKEGKRFKIYKKFYEIKLYSNIEDFKNIIESIFYLSCQPAEPFETQYELLYNVLDLYVKLKGDKDIIDLFGGDNNYKEYLLSLFNNAKSPYIFEDSFINYLNTDINVYEFPLTIEERIGLSLKYLQEYLNKENDFDDIVWHLFYSTSIRKYKKITDSRSNSWMEYPEQAKIILIEFIKNKSFKSFINEIIYSPQKGRYFFTKNIEPIFNSRDNFIDFAKKMDDSEIKKELLEFVDELGKNGFEHAIEFNFKHIKPITRYSYNVHY